MTEDEAQLWSVASTMGIIACLAIGGINTVVPEIHRQAVDVHGWMSNARFTDLFAIAQAAPGPNFIIVTLIGWDVSGLAGATAATLATIVPTTTMAFFVGKVWYRFRLARWRIAIQLGLGPVTVGLVASTGFVLSRAADASLSVAALTVLTAIAVCLTRIHPLLFLAAGGALGALGWL